MSHGMLLCFLVLSPCKQFLGNKGVGEMFYAMLLPFLVLSTCTKFLGDKGVGEM